MKTEDNGTTPKVETFVPFSVSEGTECKGWGKRHQQCLLLFFALTTAYSMRTCMGLSLVAMTESTHHVSLQLHVLNTSSNITSNVNAMLMVHNNVTNNTRVLGEEIDVGGFLLIPPYPKFDWDKKTQDMILSSFTWGYMVLQIPAGQLVHHFGSRYLLAGSLLVNSLMSILTPWVAYYGGWALLVVGRTVQGLSQACILPGLHRFLGKWAPVEERGRLSAFIFGGQALGTVLGFPLTGFIASSPLGWPGIFRMYGVISGIVGGFIWWLTADSPSEHKSISAAERRYIEEKLGQTGGKKQRPIPWGHILRCRGLYAIVMAHIGATWALVTLYSEVPAFLDKVLGVNIEANGLLSALPYFTMFLSNFFFSWFTDMLIVKKYLNLTNTRKLATTLGQAPPMIGLIVLAYAPKNIYIVETLLVLICSFNIAGHVGFYINHIDIAPNYSGTLMSISNFAANVFGSLAPLVAGFILTDPTDELLWRKVFFVSAALFFITNVVYLFLGTAERAEWDDPHEEEDKKDNGAMEPMIKNGQ